ncbi:hypothetical protein DQ04_01221040 [Trypanosoma grayi]|uniref:hypothetical protein n=1 Tax=Trypanosoma grayi TaxID=71804 RepID=UPI0004F3F4FD|nr:hypothetical protein DQ04_01221040 [Trypanosoma grayi]KEG13087.1 hypothetical protein DQ04_01221040 [Trypanosoma grayi]
MRRAPAVVQLQSVWQRRMYRTPLGGQYFEETLPSSLGATRAKGGISTAHIATGRQRPKRRAKQKLSVPLTVEGLKAQLRQLTKDTTVYSQRRGNEGDVRIAEVPRADESRRSIQQQALRGEEEEDEKPTVVATERSPTVFVDEVVVAENGDDDDDAKDMVLPGSSVLGSDLDRVEREVMRAYHQRAKELPKFDNVYAAFGGGRRGNASYHVGAEEYRRRMAKGELATTLRATRTPTRCSLNVRCGSLQQHQLGVADEEEAMVVHPAEANPHFPLECNGTTTTTTVAHGDDVQRAVQPTPPLPPPTYDAYNQRPSDDRLLELRGPDFWGDADNRHRLRQLTDYEAEGHAHEMLAEGAMDTSEVGYSANKVRKETLLYFQAHPINEMIQEPFVRVRSIVPVGGGAEVQLPAGDDDTDVDIPVSQARRMARELGLDLIRVGAIHTEKSDRRVVALCTIADHREHMRDMLRFKMQKLGVQPPPTKECVEVPFRGGTHPHAIRFKSIGVAKHLLRGHAVRLNLTDFGTPREAFPVFRSILDEVARQALQLRAYHTAGAVRSSYNEVYCYLYPSTGRSPKTSVVHPKQEQLEAARDRRILEDEREVYFDDLNSKKTARERLAYMQKLEKGTAWADKDDGLSLQRQRDMKVMLGYLPKGNRELYAARGDVDISAPFRASHPTSAERWTHPPETNLEQASRGAAVLGKRLAMTVSEMHDRQDTADSPTTLDRFYYRLQGPALEAGELKEALGLKRNRKAVPRHAPGWATLGMTKNPPEEPGYAVK